MITKIAIENFKGIGDRIEIPVRPITLLFGANSAGKSTIMQALHYVREILERQNLDATKTLTGGDSIDLGGFAEFVHKKELNRSVVVRIDFKLDWRNGDELKDYLTDDKYLNDFEVSFDANSDSEDEYASYQVNIGSIGHGLPVVTEFWVEFEVAHSAILHKPYIARYSVGAEGEKIADILYKPGNKEAEITNIFSEHPLFCSHLEFDEKIHKEVELLKDLYWYCEIHDKVKDIESLSIPFETNPEYGALPVLDKKFDLPTLLPEKQIEPPNTKDDKEQNISYKKFQDSVRSGKAIATLLTQYLIGTAEYARNYLLQLRYIGPLRVVPPKETSQIGHLDESRWSNGMGAWDILLKQENEKLVQNVSIWLSEKERLNTGYELIAKDIREIDESFQQKMLKVEWEEDDPEITGTILKDLQRLPQKRRLWLYDINKDTYVDPCAVGVGLSQIIPVIAAILADSANLIQIEQPGLHLHPTQQAAVGDLVFFGAMQRKKQILIETHSIHMILRLLRRLRDTHKKHPYENTELKPMDMIILYVDSSDGPVNVFEIGVGDDGELLQPWPDKFFDQDYMERFS